MSPAEQGAYELIKKVSERPGHGLVMCEDFYDQYMLLCIFNVQE